MSKAVDGGAAQTLEGANRLEDTAAYMAEQICLGFRHHDRREREAAVDAFAAVDERQFADLDDGAARRAAEAYVDALWAKDAVEERHIDGDELDRTALRRADWTPVWEAFRDRARVVDMDVRYAERMTTAWRNHKTGGDYWTPIREAQVYELRAALDDPDYPHKPRYGQSGHGVESARYALAVELHDMHTEAQWKQAAAVMTPYYERILRAHRTDP